MIENTILAEGLAAILLNSKKAAGEAAIKVIQETAPWDKCDAVKVYNETLVTSLRPYLEWARQFCYGRNDPFRQIVREYDDCLLTAEEFFSKVIEAVALM